MGAVVRKRHDFGWVLSKAKRDYPKFNWMLGSFDYDFTWGLAVEKGEYRNVCYLSHCGDQDHLPFNLNELPKKERKEYVMKMFKVLTKVPK